MQNPIERHIGWMVEVHYSSYYSNPDRGILRDVVDQWLELVKNPDKPREEALLIPISAVRLVKPLNPPHDEGSRLVRPATAPASDDDDQPAERR